MQSNTGRSALGQSQQHNLNSDPPSTTQWKKNQKLAREKARRQRTKQWSVTKELAALVDEAVGTFEGHGHGRKGLSLPDKKVIALLALSGWKVDAETWTMVTFLQNKQQINPSILIYLFSGTCCQR
jgi:hypothetical protein